MRKQGLLRYGVFMLVAACIVVGGASSVQAQTSNSDNYQMTDSQFGGSSSLDSCSGQYCAQTSIGTVTDGPAVVNPSTANFDEELSDTPVLEVIIEAGPSNLGVLTTEATATKTTLVKIRNHLSGGYVLQIIGEPPKFGEHRLATSNTGVASRPGTEQFGINLAVNTTPGVGAAPVQVPADDIEFGMVEAAYKTPNLFKFVSEDVVARSVSESGRTDYTISMIVNISSSTPAGHYSGDFAAVVIPSY